MGVQSENLYASVIIVSFKDKRFIYDCLTSLLDQDLSHDKYEIIFVDNGSNDGSSQYVRNNFPLVKVLELEKNYGAAEGYNKAIKHAIGKYLVFLNVDTVLHKKWLSEMLRVMEGNPKIKACHSNQITPWTSEFSKMEREGMTKYTYIYDLSRFGYVRYNKIPFSVEIIKTLFLAGASVMVEKEIVDEEGFAFDRNLPSCADIDMGLRINSLEYETVLVPTSIVYHRNPVVMNVSSNIKTLKKAINFYQGLFITYFKNMYTGEFLLFLPFLLLGAPLKVRDYEWSKGKQFFIGMASIPVVLFSFITGIAKFPKYMETRNRTLKKRKKKGYRLLNVLIKNQRTYL